MKRDPLRFLSQECFPERFQWNDPSHLREAFAVQLVDHIWDMQNPGSGREPALFRFHHVESRKGPDSPLVPAAYSGTPTPIPERATSNNIFDLEDSNDESGDGLERSVAAGERKTTAGKTVAERIHNALAKRQEKIEKEKVVGKPARTGKKASRAKARKGKARRDVMDVDKEDIGSNESGKEFDDWTAFENENDDDPEDGLGGDVDEGDHLLTTDVFPLGEEDEDEDEEIVENALENVDDVDAAGERIYLSRFSPRLTERASHLDGADTATAGRPRSTANGKRKGAELRTRLRRKRAAASNEERGPVQRDATEVVKLPAPQNASKGACLSSIPTLTTQLPVQPRRSPQ